MKNDNTLKEALHTLQKVRQNVMENEFTLFGQQVAVQLHKLSLPKALELQQKFNTMLTEARLSELCSTLHSTNSSDMPSTSTTPSRYTRRPVMNIEHSVFSPQVSSDGEETVNYDVEDNNEVYLETEQNQPMEQQHQNTQQRTFFRNWNTRK